MDDGWKSIPCFRLLSFLFFFCIFIYLLNEPFIYIYIYIDIFNFVEKK